VLEEFNKITNNLEKCIDLLTKINDELKKEHDSLSNELTLLRAEGIIRKDDDGSTNNEKPN